MGIDELNDFEVNNVIVDFNYDAKVKELLGEDYLEHQKNTTQTMPTPQSSSVVASFSVRRIGKRRP